MKVFSLFDVENKNRINLRDLKRVAKELGETMTGVRAALFLLVCAREGGGERGVMARSHILLCCSPQMRMQRPSC